MMTVMVMVMVIISTKQCHILELVQSEMDSVVFRDRPAGMQLFHQPQLLDLTPGSEAGSDGCRLPLSRAAAELSSLKSPL